MSSKGSKSGGQGGGGGGGAGDSHEEEKEVVKVCKWDGTAVKNALDDGVKEILVDKFGYDEDHTLMDTRLIICALAVAVAIFALVWDYFYPFPLSRQVLIGCVGTYFFLMMVLTLYTTYKEKGIFVVVRDKDPAGLDPDCTWEASSSMKKFDDMYTMALTFYDGKSPNGGFREDSFTRSVADFYDDNGVLCMDILETAVGKLHKSLSSAKKNS